MQVFIGSEALASGMLTPYQLRSSYTRVLPGIYAPSRQRLRLADRTAAAWLWSRRQGVVSGLAAAALHGARWVDDDIAVELNYANCKPPSGVITHRNTVLAAEIGMVTGMPVTTPARTAFDLGRQGPITTAVARLDALCRAVDLKPDEILQVAHAHTHVRGISRLPTVLDLVDAGAQSPQETRLRLMLVSAGFPRPQTQLPVPWPSGRPRYYLDMGWPDIKVAVEYDGDHHRLDAHQYRKDIERLEYIQSLGWIVVRVVAGDRRAGIVARVHQARGLR